MLIAYTIAGVTDSPAIGIAGGTWLTADGGAACVDGKPARRARYNAAGVVTVTLTFAQAFPTRIAAILGLKGVAVGAAVSVATAAGNQAGTVQRFADGSLGCWIVLPIGAAGTTAAFTLPAGTVDVGELVAMPAVEQLIDAGWTQPYVDPGLRARSTGAQLSAVRLRPFREMSVVFSSNTTEDKVRFKGMANGMDWDRLDHAIAGGQRCVAIPRWKTNERLQATAMYGEGIVGETRHVRGPFWTKTVTFSEIPAG